MDDFELIVKGRVTEEGDLLLENQAIYTAATHDLEIIPIPNYTVSFDVAGVGTPPPSQSIIEGETAHDPGDPEIYGYWFRGWYTDSTYTTEFDFSTPIYANTVIYGKMEAIPVYTISYVNDRGIVPQSKEVLQGYQLTEEDLPTDIDPEDPDYEFFGWYYDSDYETEAEIGDEVNSDITLTSKWLKMWYRVYFDLGGKGSEIPVQRLYLNSLVTKPTDPEEYGYWFRGWYTDTEYTTEWNFNTDRISGDLTLYAKWVAKEVYIVSYETDYGILPEPKEILEGDVLTAEYLPELVDSRDVMELQGWFYDPDYDTEAEVGDEVTSDITLYAKWRQLWVFVSFDTRGRSFPPRQQRIHINTTATRPADPVSDNYEFDNWYVDLNYSELFDFDTVLTENTTLYARWIIKDAMLEVDWLSSMQRTYEFYKVDPRTWKDSLRLDYIESCSINRDMNADTLGSASFECNQVFEECYIRVYMIVNQNGYSFRECLGTFLVQTPSEKFNGKRKVISMDGYTPLIELKGDSPVFGYCIRKRSEGAASDTNIMEIAYKLSIEHMRAPVVETKSDKTVYDNFLANVDDTWFSFISDFMANAEYHYALDAYGHVMFEKTVDVDVLQPRWIYTDDNSSILQPDITDERDLYSVPNIVEVIYSKNNVYAVGRAVNDDPDSPISTINRGRPVLYRDSNPNITGLEGEDLNDYIQQYAEKLLRQLSVLEHKVTYTHGYCPVRIGDGVMLNYRAAGLENVKAKVISQTIKCDAGCQVEETAVYTTKLWR